MRKCPRSVQALFRASEISSPSSEEAEDGTRTRDLLITNQLLYQLSYFGVYEGKQRILATRSSIFNPFLYPQANRDSSANPFPVAAPVTLRLVFPEAS